MMNLKRLLTGIGLAGFALFVTVTLMGATWAGVAYSETFRNLLIRGSLFVGNGTPVGTPSTGAAFFSGPVEIQGTSTLADVTAGNTLTAGGALRATSTTKAAFAQQLNASSTSTAITGKAFGDANYIVIPEPTQNVTTPYVSSKTATGFTYNYATLSTTSTVNFLVVHNQ